jgi:hypothetical protein
MVLTFVLIGLVAGGLSGLFGVGGGILIVPALVLLADFPHKTALGTSLGALLLPVGLLGAYTYWQHGNLEIRTSLLLASASSPAPMPAPAGPGNLHPDPPADVRRVHRPHGGPALGRSGREVTCLPGNRHPARSSW